VIRGLHRRLPLLAPLDGFVDRAVAWGRGTDERCRRRIGIDGLDRLVDLRIVSKLRERSVPLTDFEGFPARDVFDLLDRGNTTGPIQDRATGIHRGPGPCLLKALGRLLARSRSRRRRRRRRWLPASAWVRTRCAACLPEGGWRRGGRTGSGDLIIRDVGRVELG
jgi:hypothetical protein